jgi:hypothetical protein
MATVKNTSGDYIIQCDGGTGNLNINATLECLGNVNINESYFTVAANNNGVINAMGMIAQVTLSDWAGLRYNSQLAQWEASTSVNEDGTAILPYSPIGGGAGGGPGGANMSVQINNSGVFGGTTDFTFEPIISTVTLNGYQVFGNTGNTPTAAANTVILYSNEPASGNTGLYVTTPDTTGELINAKQAMIYSIIF